MEEKILQRIEQLESYYSINLDQLKHFYVFPGEEDVRPWVKHVPPIVVAHYNTKVLLGRAYMVYPELVELWTLTRFWFHRLYGDRFAFVQMSKQITEEQTFPFIRFMNQRYQGDLKLQLVTQEELVALRSIKVIKRRRR